MSRNRTTRNFRTAPRFRQAAGLWVGVLFLVALCAATANAQAGRFHPIQRYRQRQEQRQEQRQAERPIQNNRPAAQPMARPQAQPPAQPHQSAPIERGQPESQPRVAQSESRPAGGNVTPVRPTPQGGANGQLVVPNRPGQTQQHLAGWLEAHRNMTPAQRHQALDNDPGFRKLPPQEQQQLHQQLTRLNAMPSDERQRRIDQIENMEKLQPRDRQRVRDAMSQLGSLPEDRRAAVVRAFHNAIAMPDGQRQAWLNSPQFRSQFNENERDSMNHLLAIQPAAAQAGFKWAIPQQPAPQSPRD